MKINKNHKLRDLAGEKIIFVQGTKDKELSKVMTLNETSVFLWENLYEKDFSENDVMNLLVENYEVNPDTAQNDAKAWVEKLKSYGVIE